jgi:hypothetical protein
MRWGYTYVNREHQMKHVRIQYASTIFRAADRVILELKRLNLYEPVDIHAIPFGMDALGYCVSEGRPEIHIPVISGARFAELLPGRAYTSLADVLRHEFGHAYDFAGRSRTFRKRYWNLFGRSQKEFEFDEDLHITEYAATNSNEDFAECFMMFVKWSGKWRHRRLPGREYVNGAWEKMRFLEAVANGKY